MMMKKPKEWYDKNSRVNENYHLKLGDRVRDDQGREGTVSDINPYTDEQWEEHGPLTISDHGSITISLDHKYDGSPRVDGDDIEEEHWCLINWHRFLRRIDD
jgi:hypothetical protein